MHAFFSANPAPFCFKINRIRAQSSFPAPMLNPSRCAGPSPIWSTTSPRVGLSCRRKPSRCCARSRALRKELTMLTNIWCCLHICRVLPRGPACSATAFQHTKRRVLFKGHPVGDGGLAGMGPCPRSERCPAKRWLQG